MNNAKLWLVVPPAVGVPLFLGAVAVASFAVHVAVVTNTSWVSDYLSGAPLGTGDMAAAALPDADPAVKPASYAMLPDGSFEMTIILPDGTHAQAIVQPPELRTASTGAPPPQIGQ